ncbi:hypothetical protein RFI_27889, partial [Reticulomyxa filosa]
MAVTLTLAMMKSFPETDDPLQYAVAVNTFAFMTGSHFFFLSLALKRGRKFVVYVASIVALPKKKKKRFILFWTGNSWNGFACVILYVWMLRMALLEIKSALRMNPGNKNRTWNNDDLEKKGTKAEWNEMSWIAVSCSVMIFVSWLVAEKVLFQRLYHFKFKCRSLIVSLFIPLVLVLSVLWVHVWNENIFSSDMIVGPISLHFPSPLSYLNPALVVRHPNLFLLQSFCVAIVLFTTQLL